MSQPNLHETWDINKVTCLESFSKSIISSEQRIQNSRGFDYIKSIQ